MKFNAFCQLFCFLCVYFRVSVYYLCVLSTTDGPCNKKESVQADVAYTLSFLLPIQDTALLIEAAYPFWTCVRGPVEPDDRPRTLCTNCTQGIQYPHAGICLLGIELPRGFHTFPRGCRFPGRQERRTPPLGTSSERKSHREAIYPSTN